MKIRLMSDIHLEFGELELGGGDILLLAGDICVADLLRPGRTDKNARTYRKVFDKFFYGECAKYEKVYYVAGNHEHYNGVYDDTHDILRNYLKGTNVTFLHNEIVDLNDDYVLFGATLWTDFADSDWFATTAAKKNMNDFHIIFKKIDFPNPYNNMGGNRKLTPFDVADDNMETRDILRDKLAAIDKKFIVMTHHCPTFKSIHPRLGTDPLNFAYTNTRLEELILDNPKIKYWCHGHTHDNCDYIVGDCRVLCNPRGYFKHDLNVEFDPFCTFEV